MSDLESRADNRAIAIATLELARSLGMSCTAEGVETGFQSDFLRENGCDNLQGFFVSRAQPLDKLSHLIELKEVPDADSTPAPRPKLRIVEPDETPARAAKVS